MCVSSVYRCSPQEQHVLPADSYTVCMFVYLDSRHWCCCWWCAGFFAPEAAAGAAISSQDLQLDVLSPPAGSAGTDRTAPRSSAAEPSPALLLLSRRRRQEHQQQPGGTPPAVSTDARCGSHGLDPFTPQSDDTDHEADRRAGEEEEESSSLTSQSNSFLLCTSCGLNPSIPKLVAVAIESTHDR